MSHRSRQRKRRSKKTGWTESFLFYFEGEAKENSGGRAEGIYIYPRVLGGMNFCFP